MYILARTLTWWADITHGNLAFPRQAAPDWVVRGDALVPNLTKVRERKQTIIAPWDEEG